MERGIMITLILKFAHDLFILYDLFQATNRYILYYPSA